MPVSMESQTRRSRGGLALWTGVEQHGIVATVIELVERRFDS